MRISLLNNILQEEQAEKDAITFYEFTKISKLEFEKDILGKYDSSNKFSSEYFQSERKYFGDIPIFDSKFGNEASRQTFLNNDTTSEFLKPFEQKLDMGHIFGIDLDKDKDRVNEINDKLTWMKLQVKPLEFFTYSTFNKI